MPFIDLSDPEEMLSLLIEYVEDELNEADGKTGRRTFLSKLVEALFELEQEFTTLSGTERIEILKNIIAEVDMEFQNDSVVEHLLALVEELERIN
jgi:nicotinamide riboside kinase